MAVSATIPLAAGISLSLLAVKWVEPLTQGGTWLLTVITFVLTFVAWGFFMALRGGTRRHLTVAGGGGGSSEHRTFGGGGGHA